jgi:serine/threonine-protein kinase
VSLGALGDYTLKKEIGQGGMGKVYLATGPDGADVALKTIIFPEGLTARARWEAVERFQREARASRVLEHPHICRVIDAGADGDTFFIVMEYLDGQSLREEIESSGPLGVARSCQILQHMVAALSYAHAQGIIHRDIKPDNVMVLKSGEAKLTDFGLASIGYEAGVTQTGTMMGTLAYMSPEQARGEKLDARSDIFSLGATFYEMLAGEPAFGGEAPGAVLEEILNKELESIRGLPPEVGRIVSKCLRKRPAYRFQNSVEILDALRGVEGLEHRPQQTAVQGTVVMPDSGATPAASERKAPPSQRPQPASQRSPGPQQRKPEPQRKRSDLQCPKCKEAMRKDTPSCWKCGTPNPVLAQRRSQSQSQQAIDSALQGFKPKKKQGWRKWF